jgi:hypothetical protein
VAFAAGQDLLRSALDEVRTSESDTVTPATRRSNGGAGQRRRRRRTVPPPTGPPPVREETHAATASAAAFDHTIAAPIGIAPQPSADEHTTAVDEPETPARSERVAALRRRQRRLGLAAIVVLIALAAASLIVTQVGGGDGAASQEARSGSSAPVRVSFDSVATTDGIVVGRTWVLAGKRGDRFVGTLSFTNDLAEPVTMTHTEVIPKSLASSVDDVRFDPEPTTVIEADPVIEYSLTVPANGEVTARYEIDVEPDGASRQRLDTWQRAMDDEIARRAAATTTTTTIPAPTTTAPAPAPPVALAPPPPPPVNAAIVVRTVSQGVRGTFSYAGSRGSASLTTSEGQDVVQSATIGVPAGSYTMTQVSAPAGAVLLGVSCSDDDSGGSGASAVYNLSPGETVVCTWTNG